MMNKLRTWWRIKRREISIWVDELNFYLELPFRFVVNLVFFFTLPLWVGFAYMIWIVIRAVRERKSAERSLFTGKIWAWEMYKLY